MQFGCQQEAPYGSCASPIPHSHGWSLSPQTKKKENCPPPHPLPFQCCLKHNVNIALSIWIDKSGFVVSLFQNPAMAPGYVAFPFLYTCLISLGTPKEAPSPKCNCQSSLCLQTCPVSPAHRLGKALAASSHGPCVWLVAGKVQYSIAGFPCGNWSVWSQLGLPVSLLLLLSLPASESSPNFCCPPWWEPPMKSLQGA